MARTHAVSDARDLQADRRDRAAVAATAVLEIITAARPSERRQAIKELLRTEFADIAYEIAANREVERCGT